MTRQRWLFLAVLAILGYGALFALYPRFSPAYRWNYQLDRARAIQQAQALAQHYGVNTSGWYTQVETDSAGEGQLSYYLQQQPISAASKLFSPITTNVILHAPSAAATVTVKLNARGRPLRFAWNKRNEPEDGQPGNAMQTEAAQADPLPEKALADATFKELLGEEQTLFPPQPQFTHAQNQFKYTWTAAFDNETRLKLLAEVTIQNSQVRTASLTPSFSEAFKHEASARESQTLQLLSKVNGILLMPIAILCLLIFFVGWGNGEILHRPALYLLALAFLFIFITNYFGSFADDLRIDIPIANPWLAVLVRELLLVLVIWLFTLPLYLFWASGHSLAARLPHRRTVAFELLLQGKLNRRFLAENVAVGILLGGLVAALPFLLRALPLFQATTFNVRGVYSLFTAKLPALDTLANDHVYGVFLLFSFIVPLVEYFVPRAFLRRGLLMFAGTLWLTADEYFPLSATAALLTGFGLMTLYYAVYRYFDFLAVLASAFSGLVVMQALGLLAQPLPSLKNSGTAALIGVGVVLLVSLIGVWRGRAVAQEIFAPLLQTIQGAERDRLKAELEVASRAQQQMLPTEAPFIPGYDIAAVCRPSKDVGGDLYDFIHLPDGRLGIVVADVSGKGVPAALYMTLTKGLLASVAAEKSDPGEILREVNRHLYEACRKKVFVTLFLGVLDPATRTLTYARAGHNPTVWRSPLRNATELLRPAGMGLGLNQGKIFNATLKVATLQLTPNDTLFFYSDGITEAMNSKQEEYGEERLIAVAEQTDGLKAGSARDAIMADVKAFLGSLAPQDDQTLVVLKVT